MIEDPNRILKKILREENPQFEKLETELVSLEERLCSASDDREKNHIRRQMQSVKDQVDAVIRFARSV